MQRCLVIFDDSCTPIKLLELEVDNEQAEKLKLWNREYLGSSDYSDDIEEFFFDEGKFIYEDKCVESVLVHSSYDFVVIIGQDL